MTNPTPLLRCARCGSMSIYNLDCIERDRGEWIIRCFECGAENVLAVQPIGNIEAPMFELVGWRD